MRIGKRWFKSAGRKQLRWVVTGMALALLATLVPAAIAVGTDGGPVFFPTSGVLRLHTDGYSGRLTNPISGDYFRWTDEATTLGQQNFKRPKKSGCQVVQLPTPQDLVSFTAQEGLSSRPLGLITGDWGVSGVTDGNGTGCSRVVTPNQAITIDLNDAGPLGRFQFTSAEIDVEVKKGAVIEATLVRSVGDDTVFELRTGSGIVGDEPDPESPQVARTTDDPDLLPPNVLHLNAKCLSSSDSGPDSGVNDNCRWEIYPDKPFDAIILRAKAGEFSLAAGFDGTPRGELGALLETSDSLFALVEVYDGLVACLEEIRAGGDDTSSPQATFWRLLDLDEGVPVESPDGCKDLAYILRSNSEDQTVVLIPRAVEPDATYQARFSGELTFRYQGLVEGLQTEGSLEYDPDGPGDADFQPMLWCLSAEIGELYIGEGVEGPTVVLTAVLPGDETYCKAAEDSVVGGDGSFTTTWLVYGLEEDPGFRKG